MTLFSCPFYHCADSEELRENCSCELASSLCIHLLDPSFCSILDCCAASSTINRKKECINKNLNVLATAFDGGMERASSLLTVRKVSNFGA